MSQIEIRVPSRQYEDEDDCLSAAAADYARERGLPHGYDLSPRWADEQRSEILLTVDERELACACDSCDAMGTDRDPDNGSWYCEDCISYSCDDDGNCLCETHDIPADIEWGSIQTPGNGRSNYQEGTSSDGRRWYREDHAGGYAMMGADWTVPVLMSGEDSEQD